MPALEDVVKDPKACAVDMSIKTSLGLEGARERVVHDKLDMASNLAAGTVGSELISMVTKVYKKPVSVNKEISAVGGRSATDIVVRENADTSFADLEYLVTP